MTGPQIAAAQSETVARTAAQLTAAGTAAVATLVELLSARAETVRLGAAKAILELATSYRENEQLEARIAALEAQAADQAAQAVRTVPQRGASPLWPV